MKSFGIVYLSFGKTYVDCTIAALQSKVKNAPKTPAKMLTNREADLDSKFCKKHGIAVEYVKAKNEEAREYKTQIYKYSPYEYTLLLDADAWINRELDNQFKMLDAVPISLVHAFHHPSMGTAAHIGAEDRAYTLKHMCGLKYMPHYASGLVFFRRDDKDVQRLFDAWNDEWHVFRGKDQSALMRAIFKTGVLPLVLARKHWMTHVQGQGFVSHSFGPKLPSMPRKDRRSPNLHTSVP